MLYAFLTYLIEYEGIEEAELWVLKAVTLQHNEEAQCPSLYEQLTEIVWSYIFMVIYQIQYYFT